MEQFKLITQKGILEIIAELEKEVHLDCSEFSLTRKVSPDDVVLKTLKNYKTGDVIYITADSKLVGRISRPEPGDALK